MKQKEGFINTRELSLQYVFLRITKRRILFSRTTHVVIIIDFLLI